MGEQSAADEGCTYGLIGTSRAFREVIRFIGRVARCDAPVLIQGETGTGKELAARAIHYSSSRRHGPFIPVNCGTIPDALVESELFGHVRGAFTDAKETRSGLVSQAEGGTLFLDELEAITGRGQVALLRFLQDREYRPVGGGAPRCADVRVIGASNADLAASARRHQFREDLYFRLHVLATILPPLREREDDVCLLAARFLDRYCRQYRLPGKCLTPEAVGALRCHDWPGNVRELENLIHREVLLDDEPLLRLAALASGTGPVAFTGKPFRVAKAVAIASFERAYLTELLAQTGGNVSQAARLCGKERSRLTKLLKKHGFGRTRHAAPQLRA